MMIILCSFVLLIIPVLLGTAVVKIMGEEGACITYRYMLGFFTLFILFEGMMLVCRKAGMPFTSLCMLFSCLLVLICGITCVVCHQNLLNLFKIRFQKQLKSTLLCYALTGISLSVQAVIIVSNTYAVTEDAVIGIVQTIRYENVITGGLTGLPAFYAYLSAVFSFDTGLFLYNFVPMWFLAVSYFVYSLWADHLLENADPQKKSRNKAFFLLCISILMICGDYLFTTVPYHMYYLGWTGETIVIAVIIPFAVYVLMQDAHKKILPIAVIAAGIFTVAGFGIAKGSGMPLAEVSKLILHVNRTVNSYGKYNALFYAALLCIFLKQNGKNRTLLYYNLAVLIIVWNPLIIKGLLYIFPGFSLYWQFLWLLPTLGVIAYAGTFLFSRIEEKIINHE